MRFVIVDGYPYLLSEGKTYAVRWDANGLTIGDEVFLPRVPDWTYSELSVLAKCVGRLDSIGRQAQRKKRRTMKADLPEDEGQVMPHADDRQRAAEAPAE